MSETFIRSEVSALRMLGHEVEVVSWDAEGSPRLYSLLRLLASLRLRSILAAIALIDPRLRTAFPWRRRAQLALLVSLTLARVRKFDPEVIHAHFASMPAELAVELGRRLGIPVTATFHATDYIRRLGSDELEEVASALSRVVMVSNVALSQMKDAHPAVANRCVLVRASSSISAEAVLDRKASRNRLVTVARLVEKKGHAFLLHGLRAHLDGGADVELRIIGDGPERERLEGLVVQLDLARNVTFLGELGHSETIAEVAQATAFALICVPARDGDLDGLPVSIVESLRLGVPVLSTDVSGIPEAVLDGVNGLTLTSVDPLSIADGIEKIVSLAQVFDKVAGASRAEIEFGPISQAEKLVTMWRSIRE
ncbi:glycosyltransferase [Nocardioides cheoyonin]|uniref:glycosyltransferase n=1 Tax=Nocardioides cheoyonin TaxID=3156615 RepID=UPI0032B5F06C